jgi:hypothetical protein
MSAWGRPEGGQQPPFRYGLGLWLYFWTVSVLSRQLKLDNQRGVALCLLGKPYKSCCQIFKLCSDLRIDFTVRSVQQFKGLRPIANPPWSPATFIGDMSFYTST